MLDSHRMVSNHRVLSLEPYVDAYYRTSLQHYPVNSSILITPYPLQIQQSMLLSSKLPWLS